MTAADFERRVYKVYSQNWSSELTSIPDSSSRGSHYDFIYHLSFLFLIDAFGLGTGALRLYYHSTSDSYSYGRLEMYYSSQWYPFNIVGFDMHEADIACRKLGYSYALSYAKVGTYGCV